MLREHAAFWASTRMGAAHPLNLELAGALLEQHPAIKVQQWPQADMCPHILGHVLSWRSIIIPIIWSMKCVPPRRGFLSSLKSMQTDRGFLSSLDEGLTLASQSWAIQSWSLPCPISQISLPSGFGKWQQAGDIALPVDSSEDDFVSIEGKTGSG